MRRVRQFLLVALACTGVCRAQLIPWSAPPALEDEADFPSRPAARFRTAHPVKVARLEPAVPPPASSLDEPLLVRALSDPPAFQVLSSFAPTDPGAVRAGTSWVGQVTQNASSLTVAGSAADDNGWGASGLSLNAASYTYLIITAQRDAGNGTPTLFLQFEDRSSRTKVFSVSTSLFAVGSPTAVQIPLSGWTIDFGSNDIFAWSIGGGSVGTVPLRMTFDEVAFSVSAIPEPAASAAILAAVGLAAAAIHRRRRSRVVHRD